MRQFAAAPRSSAEDPPEFLLTSLLRLPLLLAVLVAPATAQIILDDFTAGTQPGQGSALGSWSGQVTQNATTLTIAGAAHDDNGWGVFNLVPTFDASGMTSIAVTAQLNPGHSGSSFNVQFFDTSLGSQAFSISASAFITGSMSTVLIPLGSWTSADPTQLNGWTIGGGNIVTTGPDFRMTLDQLALSSSAIPEPATYAALAGASALALAIWRRRSRHV